MKKLLLILLCLPLLGFGQGWEREFYFAGVPGEDWDDERFSVQQTIDGGYMIYCGHLIKTDQNGDTMWTKKVGYIGGDGAQTLDGGFLAVSEDTLYRLDSSGNFLWKKNVYAFAYRGVQTLDNGFAFIEEGDADQRIIKTNSTGDTLWTKQYSYDYINGNTVYVLKSLYNSIDSSFYLTGQDSLSNAVVLKLDKNGDFIWQQSYSLFNEGSQGQFITQTNDGGFVITGKVEENNCEKLLLLKVNNIGTLQWAKTISSGYCYYDKGFYVQQTNDGGYIVAGDYVLNSTERKIWLIKTDNFGDTLWTKTFGNPYGNGQSVRQTNDGGYILTGNYYQNTFSVSVVLIKLDDNGNVTSTFNIPINPNRKLQKTVDLLGRESKPQKNIPFIEIYDDGTVEKKITID